MKSSDINAEIDSADVTERLVGITPDYLNNFVQRGTFGLKASIRAGEVRARRRLFSHDDVYGAALVWLLFEAGFRTDPIIRILKDIVGAKQQATANLAARKLRDAGVLYLVIVRNARGPSKKIPEMPEQTILLRGESDLRATISENLTGCLGIIPVGSKFQDIARRMEILF